MRASFNVDRARGTPRVFIRFVPDLQRLRPSGIELHYAKVGWAVVRVLEQASSVEVEVTPLTPNSVSVELRVGGVRLPQGLEFLREIVDRFDELRNLLSREESEVELNIHCITIDTEYIMRMLRPLAVSGVEVIVLTETSCGMEEVWSKKVPVRWGSGVAS